MNMIYRKLTCCDQSITVGSSQDFKSDHLNISPIYPYISSIYPDISSIYPDISRIFYQKIKLTRACTINLIFPRYIGPKPIYRQYIDHRRYRVEHHRYRIYRRYIDGYIGYFHPWLTSTLLGHVSGGFFLILFFLIMSFFVLA